MVRFFYGGRLQCFLDNSASNSSTALHEPRHEQNGGGQRDWDVNVTAYYGCLDALAYAFQQDHSNSDFPMCAAPVGDVVKVSRRLIATYGPSL